MRKILLRTYKIYQESHQHHQYQKMIYNHFYNVAKETVVSKEINEKSDDEIKRLFRIFRDNYEIEDFKELRNLAKDHNNMNIYRVLSNAPFLNHE